MRRVVLFVALLAGLGLAAGALAAPPLEVYGRLPALDFVSLSPAGDRFAFIDSKDGVRRLTVASVDGRVIAQAPFGATEVIRTGWAGEDRVLVTVQGTVDWGADRLLRYENVVVLNLVTKTSAVLFSDRGVGVPAGISGEYGVTELNGHWYGYFGRGQELARIDLDSGIAEVVEKDRAVLLEPSSGDILARTYYNPVYSDWLVRVGPGEGAVVAHGHGEFSGATVARGRQANTFLVDQPRADGGRTLQEVSETGTPIGEAIDGDGVAGLLFEPSDHLWIGEVAADDRRRPHFFAPALDAKLQAFVDAFPGEEVHLQSMSDDLSRMVIFASGGSDSGTYYLVDLKTSHASALGYAYPDVPPDDVAPTQMMDWKAADGLQLQGVLTLPPRAAAANLPLVVMPHGGPARRSYPSFDWWAQAFASRGYAVLQPNFRGSGGFGAAFRNAGFGEFGGKMLTDISDGVAELARRGVIDPKRVCIAGDDYGGYAAAAGVTVQRGLYRCAVAVNGVFNPDTVLETHDTSDADAALERFWKAYVGAEPRGAIAPLALAGHADAPILLIYGAGDNGIAPEQSRAMAAALKAAGKPVDLAAIADGDGSFLREDVREALVAQTVAFVEKYNPSDPPAGASTQVSSASAARQP